MKYKFCDTDKTLFNVVRVKKSDVRRPANVRFFCSHHIGKSFVCPKNLVFPYLTKEFISIKLPSGSAM